MKKINKNYFLLGMALSFGIPFAIELCKLIQLIP